MRFLFVRRDKRECPRIIRDCNRSHTDGNAGGLKTSEKCEAEARLIRSNDNTHPPQPGDALRFYFYLKIQMRYTVMMAKSELILSLYLPIHIRPSTQQRRACRSCLPFLCGRRNLVRDLGMSAQPCLIAIQPHKNLACVCLQPCRP